MGISARGAEQYSQGPQNLLIASFASPDAYQPLPSLVEAARELFRSGSLTRIHRAAMATECGVRECLPESDHLNNELLATGICILS